MSDHPVAHVVIRCPACGAFESTEPGVLSDNAMMVCRECGETWPHMPPAPKRKRLRLRRRKRGNALINAEKRAVVTYSDVAEKAWQAKIEGDRLPTPPRERRLPMMAAAVASVFFLTAFFGARQAAVAALPDLAGLYSAIGLPVNLDRLSIEDVGAERAQDFDGPRVTVRATLRNLAPMAQALPPLVVVVSNGSAPIGTYLFDPPAPNIGGGEVMPVLFDVAGIESAADGIEVRFERRGETLPPAGEARRVTE